MSTDGWHSLSAVSADNIELSAVDSIVSALFYDFLTTKLCATYNDILSSQFSNETATVIYKDLSAAILDNDFKIPNKYED